ncbi:MAG: hypothetical protein M1510_09115 [Nitrospirae bacterium]|nr:hypothetical protein [Nitrospirota bacterium]
MGKIKVIVGAILCVFVYMTGMAQAADPLSTLMQHIIEQDKVKPVEDKGQTAPAPENIQLHPEAQGQYRERTSGTDAVSQPAKDIAAREKMPTVSVVAYDKRLGDVLLELGNNTNHTVIFGEQTDPNQPVVVNMRDIPLDRALDAITAQVNYGYEIKDNIIYIQKAVMRTFSIPDVAINIPTMSSELGGDMLGGASSSSGNSGFYGGAGGDSGTGSQNLRASVTLKKSDDKVDGRKIFEENIRKLLSKSGEYLIDWLSATLMVYDSPRNIKFIGQYVKTLRTESDKLLLVEATITQVSTKSDFRFGIDWNVLAERLGGEKLTRGDGQKLTIASTVTDIASPTLTITRTATDITAVLKALEEQGDVKILSTPYIYARNLQPVAIFSGKSVPYIGNIQTTVTGTAGTAQTNFTISRAQDGVMLSLKAHIRDDQKIDVQLTPIQSNIEEFATFTIDQNTFTNPVSSVQQTLQSITLKDGETVIIGGIRKERKEKSSKGVPILSKVPFLCGLFKSTSDSNDNSELVIALKVRRVTL